MARRKRHESALAALGIGFIAVIAFCCGGPIAFLSSPPSRQSATSAPKSSQSPAQTAVVLTPRKPAPNAVTTPARQPEHFAAPPATATVIPSAKTAPTAPSAAEQRAPAAEPAKIPATPDLFRTWTDDSGGFSVVAIVARFDENEAKLQREDGKLLAVPLSRLSQADRSYLTEIKFPPTFLTGGKVAIGKTVGISDGDTIKLVDDDKGNYTIRLEGIDAPESHQAFGTQAKKALSDKVFGKVVRVEWKETDKYGRTLGHVYLGRRHINLELLEEGMAWHYKKYSSDETLAAAEVRAKAQKLGLWRHPNPIAPWDFRNGGAEGQLASAPTRKAQPVPFIPLLPNQSEPVSLTVYVTETGTKYHRGGCRHLSKSRIAISLERARASYSPCAVCKPP